jgi:DNA-binding NarL/FixJ family response regulator
VLHADRLGPSRAQVSVQTLPEAALSALNEARVRHLADQAQLSERERAVLGYLLLGSSLGDIAGALGISARTVKFHQQNVLSKLGSTPGSTCSG